MNLYRSALQLNSWGSMGFLTTLLIQILLISFLIGGAKTITKAANGSDNAINIEKIIPGVAHKVVLTIAYNLDSTKNAGAGNRPDGPMTVTIPDIQLVYESVSYNEANNIQP